MKAKASSGIYSILNVWYLPICQKDINSAFNKTLCINDYSEKLTNLPLVRVEDLTLLSRHDRASKQKHRKTVEDLNNLINEFDLPDTENPSLHN